MCLIILAPQGSDKNSEKLFEYIKYSSKINKDGMGLAFKRVTSNKIYVNKGHTDPNKVIELIKKFNLKERDELVIHARIGNKGEVSNENCHPFVVNGNDEFKNFLAGYVDKPVLFHNGTFLEYSSHNSKDSDTYLFNRDFLSDSRIQDILFNSKDTFESMFKSKLNDSRTCVLRPIKGSGIVTTGKYYTEDGYLFSKNNYKPYVSNTNYAYNSCNGYTDDYTDPRYQDLFKNSHILGTAVFKSLNTKLLNKLKVRYEDLYSSSAWDLLNNEFANFRFGLIFPDEGLEVKPLDFFKFQVNPLTFNLLDFKKISDSPNNTTVYSMTEFNSPEFNGREQHILAIKGEEDNYMAWEYVDQESLFYSFTWTIKSKYSYILRDYLEIAEHVFPSLNTLNALVKAYNNTSTSYCSVDNSPLKSIHHHSLAIAIYNIASALYNGKSFYKFLNQKTFL